MPVYQVQYTVAFQQLKERLRVLLGFPYMAAFEAWLEFILALPFWAEFVQDYLSVNTNWMNPVPDYYNFTCMLGTVNSLSINRIPISNLLPDYDPLVMPYKYGWNAQKHWIRLGSQMMIYTMTNQTAWTLPWMNPHNLSEIFECIRLLIQFMIWKWIVENQNYLNAQNYFAGQNYIIVQAQSQSAISRGVTVLNQMLRYISFNRSSIYSVFVLFFSLIVALWSTWHTTKYSSRLNPDTPTMGGSATFSIEPEHVAEIMLSWSDLELILLRKTQSLWAGYGHICEVKARRRTAKTDPQVQEVLGEPRKNGEFDLILKLISLPPTKSGSEDEGHLRKIFSYEVEQAFYSLIAPLFDGKVAMARTIATTRDMEGKPGADLLEGLTATLMTDLRTKYPVAGEKRSLLNDEQVHSALDWLSTFHRESWSLSPIPEDSLLDPPLIEAEKRKSAHAANRSLWLNGGYTYLATRRKEYALLCSDQGSEWSAALCGEFWRGQSVAEVVADVVKMSPQSLIHGDVKSENLFTSRDGSEVAFYDFQYVGFGLGVCDLAKLFTCSVPLSMLVSGNEDYINRLTMGKGERRLLERYHENLLAGTKRTYDWNLFIRHWETALVDWLRFQASWGFWGNTEWLEARVRCILNDISWREWLKEQ
ncbi:hypothetical protein GGR57DRAFT_505868 [Xylariaceae sp. FL1272]|nr:hypothetical protein GGR57DRAFT_505868 [Xylariaceae sp. FL1272]